MTESNFAEDPHAHNPLHGGPQGAHHGPTGVMIYVMVAIALVILTSFSYATQLPLWSTLIGDSLAVKRTWMMAVSCTKAMLVILFFMHLKWEANWKWIVTVPASMMSLLLVLALIPDIGRRMNYASHDRLTYSAEQPEREAKGKPGTALRDIEHPVGE